MERLVNSSYRDVVKSNYTNNEREELGKKGQISKIYFYKIYNILKNSGLNVEQLRYIKEPKMNDKRESRNSTNMENIRNEKKEVKESQKTHMKNINPNINEQDIEEELEAGTVKTQSNSKISNKKISANQPRHNESQLKFKTIRINLGRWNRKYISCKLCNRNFLTEFNLEKHIDSAHLKIRKYECDICKCMFILKKHVKSHIQNVHLKIKNYKCEECDYKASQKYSLNKHIYYKHLKSKLNLHKAFIRKSKRFNNSVQKNISIYKCDKCGHCFTKKAYLRKHFKRIHFNLKKFKCDNCDYATVTKHHLLEHMNARHLDIKDHKCTMCNNFRSAYKASLNSHIKNIHMKIKSHKCTECSFATLTEYQLTTHVNAIHHLKLKPFQCPHCQFRTTQKSNLTTHIKKRHNK